MWKLFLNVLNCCVNLFCFWSHCEQTFLKLCISCVNFVPTFFAHCTLVSKPSENFISVSRRARGCAWRRPPRLLTAWRGTAQRSFVSCFSTAGPAAVGCPMEPVCLKRKAGSEHETGVIWNKCLGWVNSTERKDVTATGLPIGFLQSVDYQPTHPFSSVELWVMQWKSMQWWSRIHKGGPIGKLESGKAPHLFQGLVVAKMLRLPQQKLMNIARINAG